MEEQKEQKSEPRTSVRGTEEQSPKGQSTGASVSPAQHLFNLLEKEPVLMFKLLEALQAERFFITVTVQKKRSPDEEHDLHHSYIRKNIMVNDVVPILKHIASDFIAKENPTAEQPDKTTWH